MPNQNKKTDSSKLKLAKQKEKQRVHDARLAERTELILHKRKMRSEISKSRIKRDNLLSDLSHKIDNAKLKEAKLKAKLRQEAIKEKNIATKQKAGDRIEISEYKKLIREKQAGINQDKKAIRQELALTSAEIRNKKIANRKSHQEEKASAIAVRNEKRAEYRKEANEIRLKNKQAKTEFLEARLIQKNKNAEKSLIAKNGIREEKLRLAKEKEKLRNLKNEKASLAKAKRLEKAEKAKIRREKLMAEKAKAKEAHRQEILQIKANKLTKAQINAARLNKLKAKADEELEETNEIIETQKDEIKEIKQDAKETIANNAIIDIPEKEIEEPVKQEESEFSDSYHSAFAEEEVSKDEETKRESYHEKIAGSVIRSFGKNGAKKFKVAESPAIESDIAKYKKDIIATEMIERFRKESPEAIKVKSFAGYIEILLDKRFTTEDIDQFYAHAITAILTGHSIRFANGFIMPLRNGKKINLEFAEHLEDGKTLVELSNPEVGEEINKLITKKINAGGSILLANGLLAIKEQNEILFLQDTNFMKG